MKLTRIAAPLIASLYLSAAAIQGEDGRAETAKNIIVLHSDGDWGIGMDITIHPDDSYRVHSYSSKTKKTIEDQRGYREGIFKDLIDYVTRMDAWGITTERIIADFDRATEDKRLPSIGDAGRERLLIRSGGREISAATEAGGAKSSLFPEARVLAVYWTIIRRIERATVLRQQGGADQPATAPESKPEGEEKPKPESEGRSQ